MTSLLNRPSINDRRHTTDHTAQSTNNTPVLSRSSSVNSVTSHKSEPSWFSAYNGDDTTRKASTATTASKNSVESKKSSKGGFFSFLNEDPKLRKEMKMHKEAEKKRKNEQRRKDIDKLVITSKHAAAIRRKLGSNPYKKDDGSAQPQHSAHLSAAAQEMRFPHSGPPALHGGHKADDGKHDMPALTRIMSGDERDDEEDYMEKRREAWLQAKRPDVGMRHLSEHKTPPESPSPEESDAVEVFGHSVLEVQDMPIIGVELDGEKYAPKPYKERHGRPGYHKDEKGVWTREKEGPFILHNV